MICLRCGICCISHAVIVVVDPEPGPVKGNLAACGGGQRCPHQQGEEAPFTCAVHDRPWFPKSPCGRHKQFELHTDELCRLGNYHLNSVDLPGVRA